MTSTRVTQYKKPKKLSDGGHTFRIMKQVVSNQFLKLMNLKGSAAPLSIDIHPIWLGMYYHRSPHLIQSPKGPY